MATIRIIQVDLPGLLESQIFPAVVSSGIGEYVNHENIYVMDGRDFNWRPIEWRDMMSQYKGEAYELIGSVGKARVLPVIRIRNGKGVEVPPLSKRGKEKFNKS